MVATASNFASTVVNRAGLTATFAAVSGLAPGSIYYWEANAANGAGSGLGRAFGVSAPFHLLLRRPFHRPRTTRQGQRVLLP